MTTSARLAEFAALLGNPTRAGVAFVLMDGRALTASELARATGVSPQTASEHLDKMVKAELLTVQRQGRHRFHRLASANIARLIEHIVQAAPESVGSRPSPFTGPRDSAMRMARTCYDHLAGRLGVALADALASRGHVELADEAGVVTASGIEFFDRLGMDMTQFDTGRVNRGRILCRPCLDWSERRPHLAGALGAALCSLSLQREWVRRCNGSRAIMITAQGRRSYQELFGVQLDV